MIDETVRLRRALALLRITLGLLILFTWYENLNKGLYTAEGITGLFDWLFNTNEGGPMLYRALINSTILHAPGAFALFQMAAELALGLGLLFGALTPLAGAGAALFFFNLSLAFFGGHEWIWTYVLLTVSAGVVAMTQAGRVWGVDHLLWRLRGEPPAQILW